MSDEGVADASPDARAARLHIKDVCGSLLDGKAEPGFAEGDAGGKIESQEGLFGAGLADDDVEAWASEKIRDDPFDGRWGTEGVSGRVDVDVVVVSMGEEGLGFVDLPEHSAVLRLFDEG